MSKELSILNQEKNKHVRFFLHTYQTINHEVAHSITSEHHFLYFVCILHSCRIKDYLILKTSTQPFQKLNVSHETAPPTKNPTT